MKYTILLLAVFLQGCSLYDNAIVDPEVRKIREIQRINELHAATELRPFISEMENQSRLIRTRDIVGQF